MRALRLGCCALYFVSAGLQYNDPDPQAWVLIYSAAAAALILPPGGRWTRGVCSFVAVVALVWGALLLPEASGVALSDLTASMQAKGGRVEIAREAGGLLLVALGMVGALMLDHRARGATARG